MILFSDLKNEMFLGYFYPKNTYFLVIQIIIFRVDRTDVQKSLAKADSLGVS